MWLCRFPKKYQNVHAELTFDHQNFINVSYFQVTSYSLFDRIWIQFSLMATYNAGLML